MLPSSTYTKRSALCRCGWEASPGAKATLSTMPSLPGTSGRSLVIRRVTCPTCAFTLPHASTLLHASNRNDVLLFIFGTFNRIAAQPERTSQDAELKRPNLREIPPLFRSSTFADGDTATPMPLECVETAGVPAIGPIDIS